VQNLNEVTNVFFRKFDLSPQEISEKVTELSQICVVKPVTVETIQEAIRLKSIYRYSYFDCIMLASALFANCSTFYSEDFQHGQIIENCMKIVNPFAKQMKGK